MRTIISLFSLVALVGCGSYSEDIGPSNVPKLDIAGKYNAACHSSTWLGSGNVLTELTAGDGLMTKSYKWSQGDVSCSTMTILITVQSTYQIGEKVAVPADAVQFDSQVQRITAKPLTQYWAAYLSANKVCGVTNWQANIEFDVTRFNCSAHLPIPAYHYGVAKWSFAQLFFGATVGAYNGSSPALRTQYLDLNEAFSF